MRSLHEGNIQDRMNFRLWISYGMRFEVECFKKKALDTQFRDPSHGINPWAKQLLAEKTGAMGQLCQVPFSQGMVED